MRIDIYTYAGTVGGGRPAHRLVTNSAASPRLDRTALSLGPMFEDSNEREYWHSRTPAERLRQITSQIEQLQQQVMALKESLDKAQEGKSNK